MTAAPITVDLTRRTVLLRDGSPVHLTWAEFSLVAALIEAQGEVRTRAELVPAVFRRPYQDGARHLDQVVLQLRRKLPRDIDGSSMVRSVRGVGYWMRALERQQTNADRWVAA